MKLSDAFSNFYRHQKGEKWRAEKLFSLTRKVLYMVSFKMINIYNIKWLGNVLYLSREPINCIDVINDERRYQRQTLRATSKKKNEALKKK